MCLLSNILSYIYAFYIVNVQPQALCMSNVIIMIIIISKKDCHGLKDQLMINNAILENCRKRKKNLSTAWIDYIKAFDSVPHSWIIKCMALYKVHPKITNFTKSSMTRWKTNTTLVDKQGVLETAQNSIKQGIFQGYSLSLLLFAVSLNLLSKALKRLDYMNKPTPTTYSILKTSGYMELMTTN